MDTSFDLYVPRPSWLHRLDPRTKLSFVAAAGVVLLSVQHLGFLVASLALWHGVLLSARVPAGRVRWIWERMLPLTLLIVFLWPLFDPQGQPILFDWWRVRITADSVLRGLATALRVDSLAFAFFILLVSTDQAGLVRGLVRLGLPYTWGLTLAIALRYIPTLHGVYVNVREAQQARGWIVGEGGLPARVRSYLPVLVAVIIIALRMTDHLAMALAARGLGAGARRSAYQELRLGRHDGLCLAGLLIVAGALLVARWGYGWGAVPW